MSQPIAAMMRGATGPAAPLPESTTTFSRRGSVPNCLISSSWYGGMIA